MKTLLAIVFLLVPIVIGTGFYRGWSAGSSPDAVNGDSKTGLTLTVDQDKIKAECRCPEGKVAGVEWECGR